MQTKFNFDIVIFTSMVVLTIIGILFIYSTDYSEGSNRYIKQALWFIASLIVTYIIMAMDYRRILRRAWILYVIACFFLLLTLAFGKTIRGSKSWFVIGPVSLQVSEFTKIATIMFAAIFIASRGDRIKSFHNVLIALAITMFPVGLILMQPDFGTTLSYFPPIFAMLFVAGARIGHLLSIIAVGFISAFIPLTNTYAVLTGKRGFLFSILSNYLLLMKVSIILLVVAIILLAANYFLNKKVLRIIITILLIVIMGLSASIVIQKMIKPYQIKRILSFFDASRYRKDYAYNIIQSKIAIGSGGFWGKGFLKGTQNKGGFIPEKSTDFIFSVIGEEGGVIATTLIFMLYIAIIYRGYKKAFISKDFGASLVIVGIITLLAFHILFNIGMTLGMAPASGIPLPFLSYGGSFLLTTYIGIAIILNIEMRRYIY